MFYKLDTVLLAIGLCVACVLLALGMCGAMMLWDKRQWKKGFDERQMMHRGRGTTLGFFVAVFYGFGLIIWEGYFGPVTWDMFTIGSVGMWLPTLVTITYLILTDAWMPPNTKYGWAGVFWFVLGGTNLVSFYHLNKELTWLLEMGLEPAAQSHHFFSLLTGITCMFWGVLIMITQWHYSRE